MGWLDRFNKALRKEAEFCKRDLEACKKDKNVLAERISGLELEKEKLDQKVAEKEKIISLLDLKIGALRAKPEEAESLATISISELDSLLKPVCANVYLSDNTYNLTSAEQAAKFCEETKIRSRQWKEEEFDCDEFSFALLGYWNEALKNFAFGIAWSDNHAFDLMIDHQKKVWIVEPQTNEFMTLEEAKNIKSPNGPSYWPLRLVLI